MKHRRIVVLASLLVLSWILAMHLADQRRVLGMDTQRDDLPLDPVEVVGTKLLSPFRGFMVDALWIKSQSSEIQDNMGQLPVIYDLITSLQPNLVEAAIFAGMNLGMDLSSRTGDPDEQWHWVRQGLGVLDKSLARNTHHPRAWRLEFQRAYLISQRCLPTSRYTDHGAHCARMYEKEFGSDPREDAAQSLKSILSEPKVPTGWLSMYPGIYESWSMEMEDPVQEAALLERAVAAWKEVLAARPDLDDDHEGELLEAKLALARARSGAKGGSLEARQAWMEAGWQVARIQWLDPQIARHFRTERTASGDNMYLLLLERRAQELFGEGNHLAVTEIASICREALEDPKMSPPTKDQQIRWWRLEALSHDILAGACSYLASETKDELKAQELSQMANSHRRQAVSAFEKILELSPDDEEVKTKMSLIKNAIK